MCFISVINKALVHIQAQNVFIFHGGTNGKMIKSITQTNLNKSFVEIDCTFTFKVFVKILETFMLVINREMKNSKSQYSFNPL